MKNKAFIENYLSEAGGLIGRLPTEKIDQAIELFLEAYRNGNHVFFMGNGGSASNASHFAADLSKTAVMKAVQKDGTSTLMDGKRFKAFTLVENPPLISAWTNDFGFESIFKGQLEGLIQKNDLLVGISVHGGKGFSSNLSHAFKYARLVGAKCIGFSGFDGGEMNELCDVNVVVPIENTPHIESFHSVIQHLIIFCIRDRLAKEKGVSNELPIKY